MNEFRAQRVSHEYIQKNAALPQRVFPLFCPVREADWIPDWRYRMIYSESGFAELGCVFATPNEDGTETTWVISEYDAQAFRIGLVWVDPGKIAARMQISLASAGIRESVAHIRYTFTSLSPQGNEMLAQYTEDWFLHKMMSWERAINHYLRLGKMISLQAWECPA